MNSVCATKPKNCGLKSRIPVGIPPSKSRIPVAVPTAKSQLPLPIQPSKVPNLNNKRTSGHILEKKSQVSNAKKINFPQNSYVPKKELPTKSVVHPANAYKINNNKATDSLKCKPANRGSKLTLKKNYLQDKNSKINIQQIRPKVLSQVNNQKNILHKKNNQTTKRTELKAVSKEKEKENKEPPKPDHLALQKDIKFEANEFFRDLILTGKGLSPSILKQQPSIKLSSVYCERPSAYQPLEIPADPFKEALKALGNIHLSVKKDRVSLRKKETRAPVSPFKDRGSFYTPYSNPKEELLRSLDAFKKQQLKTASKSEKKKKVTFNLDVEEYTCKVTSNREQTPFRRAEDQLTQIIEKSEENTPNSPDCKTNETTSTVKAYQSKPQASEFSNKENESSNTCAESGAASQIQQNPNDCIEKCGERTMCEHSEFCTPLTKLGCFFPLSDARDNNEILAKSINTSEYNTERPANVLFQNLTNLDNKILPPTVSGDSVKQMYTASLKSQTNVDIRTSVLKNMIELNIKKSAQAKVYTPRPMSFYSKSRLINSSSPEFLTNGTADRRLSEYAPICTPLVLKSLAKSPVESPETDSIRLKLDFMEEEKDSPRKAIPTKSFSSLTLQKIITLQQKLDDMADQECALLFLNENTNPVVCGRYLRNPVALTLAEGDEMHFIPILF